jgi:hypothetical protein
MNIMTGGGAGNGAVSSKRELPPVQPGFLADRVTDTDTEKTSGMGRFDGMAIQTELIQISGKLSFCRAEGKPAAQFFSWRHVTDGTIACIRMWTDSVGISRKCTTARKDN